MLSEKDIIRTLLYVSICSRGIIPFIWLEHLLELIFYVNTLFGKQSIYFCCCQKNVAVITYVACAYVQPAPDNGVDRHEAGGWVLAKTCAREQGVLSHVIGGQHLHLMKGLHCWFTLTQHILGMQNRVREKEMRCIYLQVCIWTQMYQCYCEMDNVNFKTALFWCNLVL